MSRSWIEWVKAHFCKQKCEVETDNVTKWRHIKFYCHYRSIKRQRFDANEIFLHGTKLLLTKTSNTVYFTFLGSCWSVLLSGYLFSSVFCSQLSNLKAFLRVFIISESQTAAVTANPDPFHMFPNARRASSAKWNSFVAYMCTVTLDYFIARCHWCKSVNIE